MTANKRIALNVLATNCRSLFAIVCSFFTARWSLMALGQEGHGLIGLIAGLIVFVSLFNRLLGKAIARFYACAIGEVMSVDATCTSLMPPYSSVGELKERWNARQAWAPAALLAVFQILGCDYEDCHKTSFYAPGTNDFDIFTKYDFKYSSAVATVKVGKGVKSEGELIVSGTKGYIYVPAPWWKMDYFEVRYENIADNRRYFYQLDGEGIRYELVMFAKLISVNFVSNIKKYESISISTLMR